jgi:hypothetical protein
MRPLVLMLAALPLLPGLVLADNQPPVANAGPDQTAYTNDWVNCSGTAVDPEGDPILGYVWEIFEKPPLAYVRTLGEETPSFELAGSVPGDYVVNLTVWDGMSIQLGTDQATIHFRDNQPPVAVAAADRMHVDIQDTVSFTGAGSYDPEGGPLSYLWFFTDGSLPVYEMDVRHVFAMPGTFVAELQVWDERNATAMQEIVIEAGSLVRVPAESRAVAVTLRANAPNPSNPRTSFGFSLPQAGRALLVVYDVRGARVATLVDAELPAGEQGAQWSGTNERGEAMPSGVYFCRLVAGDRVRTVKFALVK